MTLPKGTCMVHDGSPVGVFAQVNDVRQQGSAYSWYLRIKFELADDQPKHIALSKLALYYPLDAHAEKGPLNRYDVGNTTNVMFWPITFENSGELLPETVRLHTHRARHAGYVLVKGNHTLGNLIGSPRDCYLSNECSSVAAVRRLVLKKAGSSVLCHDDPEVPSFVTLDGHFDRQGSIFCKAFSFAKGDTVTVFSFSTPVWAADMNPFPQHTIMFAYYRPLLGTSIAEQLYPEMAGRSVL